MNKTRTASPKKQAKFITARIAPHARSKGNLFVHLRNGQDVILRPWESTLVEADWLQDQEMLRLVEEGIVEIETSNVPPRRADYEPSAALVEGMNPAVVQTIKYICSSPYGQQSERIINLHEHLSSESGMPKPGTLVTVEYLKRVHTKFLKAIADLEKRWQNRPEVVAACKSALDAIGRL